MASGKYLLAIMGLFQILQQERMAPSMKKLAEGMGERRGRDPPLTSFEWRSPGALFTNLPPAGRLCCDSVNSGPCDIMAGLAGPKLALNQLSNRTTYPKASESFDYDLTRQQITVIQQYGS